VRCAQGGYQTSCAGTATSVSCLAKAVTGLSFGLPPAAAASSLPLGITVLRINRKTMSTRTPARIIFNPPPLLVISRHDELWEIFLNVPRATAS
jgi:hypothetical protein